MDEARQTIEAFNAAVDAIPEPVMALGALTGSVRRVIRENFPRDQHLHIVRQIVEQMGSWTSCDKLTLADVPEEVRAQVAGDMEPWAEANVMNASTTDYRGNCDESETLP